MTTALTLPTGSSMSAYHPVSYYLSTLRTADGRRTMLTAINNIAAIDGKTWDTLRWEKLLPEHVGIIYQRISEVYAPSTANRHLAALRGVLKACWKLQMLDIEQYHRLIDFKPVRGKRLPAGRDIKVHEARALLLSCVYSREPIDIRDAAIIALLYRCGLRRAECALLTMESFNPTDGLLTLVGKGNKERVVDVVKKTRTLLDRWLEVRGTAPGALFVPVNKHGTLTYRHLTTQSIYDIIIRRAAAVGIGHISPHDFRRTLIGDLLDEGVDIAAVAEIVGHEDVNTTRHYDRRGARARREAAKKIDLPI